jgi:hypothetical protein
MQRWLARAAAYSAAPSSCRSLVEPSTSVKRKVTVPEGRSRRTASSCAEEEVHATDGVEAGASEALPKTGATGPLTRGLRRNKPHVVFQIASVAGEADDHSEYASNDLHHRWSGYRDHA